MYLKLEKVTENLKIFKLKHINIKILHNYMFYIYKSYTMFATKKCTKKNFKTSFNIIFFQVKKMRAFYLQIPYSKSKKKVFFHLVLQ